MAPYLDCLRRDAAFHGFVVAYALVGWLVGIAFGVPHKYAPLSYAAFFFRALPLTLASALIVIGLWSLWAHSPVQAFGGAIRHMLIGPQRLAGLVLFASMVLFLGVFTSVKTMLTDIVPFHADRFLADLDRVLHGRDPWQYATALLPPTLTNSLETLYVAGWSVLLLSSMLACVLLPKFRAIRTRYVWTFLVIWPLLGNVVAGSLMSAGPIYFERVTGDPRFEGLAAYLAQHSNQDWVRAFLWQSYVKGQAAVASGISAFPSLHLAVATILVLLARHIHRWLMWAALAFCVLIQFGSVHLGWHYAVDGYFSIVATALIWKAVGWAVKPKPRMQAHWPKPTRAPGYGLLGPANRITRSAACVSAQSHPPRYSAAADPHPSSPPGPDG